MNLNQPMGFKPVGYITNSLPYIGGGNVYYKAAGAGALGMFDPVVRAANSTDPEGGPMVVRYTAGGAFTGVVVGFMSKLGEIVSAPLLDTAEAGYLIVADDPNLLFEVQQGGVGSDLAITNIGDHIDGTTAAAPNLITGFSTAMLDVGAIASGNTFRIERLSPRADNLVGQYSKWYVSANLHTEAGNSTTYRTEV